MDFKVFDNVRSILKDDLKAELKSGLKVGIVLSFFSIYACCSFLFIIT